MLRLKLNAKMIKASDPFGKGGDWVEIEISPTRDLTEEEIKIVNDLFPHCQHTVEQMLTTEAVIASIRKE